MWKQITAMEELRKISRWKVEFFCKASGSRASTGYPLQPLKTLVAERRETINPQTRSAEQFNYIGLENIQSLTGELINFQPKLGEEVLSRSKIFKQGDVLYGRLRPYLNKVYLAEEPMTEGICSGEFYVLVPDADAVLPNYLRALLSSDYIQRYVGRWQTGSALPRLQLSDLLHIQVPVPPMEVQQAYEQFLTQQIKRRRELAAELSTLPARTIQAVTDALENGGEITALF